MVHKSTLLLHTLAYQPPDAGTLCTFGQRCSGRHTSQRADTNLENVCSHQFGRIHTNLTCKTDAAVLPFLCSLQTARQELSILLTKEVLSHTHQAQWILYTLPHRSNSPVQRQVGPSIVKLRSQSYRICVAYLAACTKQTS